jgi:hypothetical protein
MPSNPSLASRPVVRWLAAAALIAGATVAITSYLGDGVEYRTCEEKLQIMEALEPGHVWMQIIQDRAERWLVAHPTRYCPRGTDIASERELVEHGYKAIELTCNEARHVVAITTRPLVSWPQL